MVGGGAMVPWCHGVLLLQLLLSQANEENPNKFIHLIFQSTFPHLHRAQITMTPIHTPVTCRLPGGAPAHRLAPLGAVSAPTGGLPRADPRRSRARVALPVPCLRPERRRTLRPRGALRPPHCDAATHSGLRPLLRQGTLGHCRYREREGNL